MRGINKTIISGNVSREIKYSNLSDGTPVVSFSMASDRCTDGVTVTAWVRVNVFISSLVELCRVHLSRGSYVIVEGELMNREGRYGQLIEIRAKEIIFFKGGK